MFLGTLGASLLGNIKELERNFLELVMDLQSKTRIFNFASSLK